MARWAQGGQWNGGGGGGGGGPPTPEEQYTITTGLTLDLGYTGQLVPIVGAGTLTPVNAGVANQPRDRLVAGALTDALYTAPGTVDALAAPPGIGDIQDGQSFLAAFCFRMNRPAAIGALVGKRDVAPAIGWDITLNADEELTGGLGDSGGNSTDSVIRSQFVDTPIDGIWHEAGLLVDFAAGLFFVAWEQGISAGMPIPAGTLTNASLLQLGRGRLLSVPGLEIGHLLFSVGTQVEGINLLDHVVALHRLTIDDRAAALQVNDRYQHRPVATLNGTPSLVVATGAGTLLNVFALTPAPITKQVADYALDAAGTLFNMVGPGPFQTTLQLEYEASANITAGTTVEVGFALGGMAPIILTSISRISIAQGANRIVSASVDQIGNLPAIGGGAAVEVAVRGTHDSGAAVTFDFAAPVGVAEAYLNSLGSFQVI